MKVTTRTAKRWHQRWLVRIPLAFVALIVALGIVAVATAPEPPAPPQSAPATPTTPTAMVVTPADPDAYLRGIAAIDPGLSVNRERALNRAENVCQEIAAGKDDATVTRNARERLSGGNASVNDEQAAAVVELARTHICR